MKKTSHNDLSLPSQDHFPSFKFVSLSVRLWLISSGDYLTC